MRKFISVVLSAVASLLLIYSLLFTAVEISMSDNTFINNEYTKLGLAKQMGMSNADLVNSCIRLVDYMKGDVPNIDIEVTINGEEKRMFEQEQEIVHMQDVRILYQTCREYRDVGVVLMLILFLLAALLSVGQGPLHSVAKGFLWGAFLAGLVLGFVGTWAALDFSSFWTAFHETLFWNNLWLFDPTESRMINMLPEEFFRDMVLRIVLYAGTALVVLLVLAIVAVVLYHRKKEKEYEAALEAAVALEQRRRAAAEQKRAPRILSPEEKKARMEKKKRLAKKRAMEAAAEGAKRKKKRPEGAASQQDANTPRKKKRPADAGVQPAQRRKKPRPASGVVRMADGEVYDPNAEYPNDYPEYNEEPAKESESEACVPNSATNN